MVYKEQSNPRKDVGELEPLLERVVFTAKYLARGSLAP